jgi:hypothetical protein
MNAYAKGSIRQLTELDSASQNTEYGASSHPNISYATGSGIRELRGAEADKVLAKVGHVKKVRGREVVAKCFLIILIYTMIGWASFSPIFGWTFIDSFYFAMVTVTTVGYGDLTPEDDDGQQIFIACYAFLGVAFLAAILSELSTRLVRYVKKMAMRAKETAMQESRVLLEQVNLILKALIAYL